MSGPKPAISIPLVAIKRPAVIGHLDYTRVALARPQKRLVGRYALVPDIDLNAFKTRAVIDWIKIAVLLDRSTQFQWIQQAIKPAIGRVPHVANLFANPNAASNTFAITIQEPKISRVYEAMEILRSKFGLAMDPVVRGMEISVDFTPRTPSDLDRARMMRVLANHISVHSDVIANIRERPRTVWGTGSGNTQRLLFDSGRLSEIENREFLISPDRDSSPFADGTLEIGAREASARWRVMDKVKDQQNHSAGTFLDLDDGSKRARIEVTLDLPELRDLGVEYLDDLKALNFTKLQGRYFRFYLPTFDGSAETMTGARPAFEKWRDRSRTIKFMKTGMIGLKAMEQALGEQKREMRRAAIPMIHRLGLTASKIERVGLGETRTFVAYEELNKRVLTALRNLGKRAAADFPESA